MFCELYSACGSIVAGEFFKGWGLRRNLGIGGVPFTGWEDPDYVYFFLPSAGVRDMCYRAWFFFFISLLRCQGRADLLAALASQISPSCYFYSGCLPEEKVTKELAVWLLEASELAFCLTG